MALRNEHAVCSSVGADNHVYKLSESKRVVSQVFVVDEAVADRSVWISIRIIDDQELVLPMTIALKSVGEVDTVNRSRNHHRSNSNGQAKECVFVERARV